ncbi:DUF2771 domain-containing protein [Corynebacterium sp.]|uniref:DUF2771 domain-containing protein n=1 Tax=Corynebacterium sp. TaxID=1720 RepID=UPI0026DB9446|nr:DUF2771 domain-containing protein [Corynebacterium sp.]MDO5076264.1 DUF2771 domain-containing protein [Corynebacterium sp.]
MASTQRRTHLRQFLILIVAVVLVVTISIGFQQWWNNRPDAEPSDVKITASSGGQTMEISPYSVCELGTPCEGETVPEFAVDGSLKLTLPKDIYDHDWRLLKIYDDPEANHEEFYSGHEQTEVDVAAVTDAGAKLTVVEVTTALIGHNDAGEEAPYTVVWSLKVKQ